MSKLLTYSIFHYNTFIIIPTKLISINKFQLKNILKMHSIATLICCIGYWIEKLTLLILPI